jgi:hypothetical protein
MILQHFKNMAATSLIVVTALTILGTTVWGDIISVIQKSKEQTIGVPIDRAVVIESAVPFAELSIANPAIADFSTLSDRTVYILGKLAGTTTLTLIDKKGNLISNVQIKVTTDLNELRKRLKEILPNEKIKVRSANDGIVLHGKVSTVEASDKAVLLANRYAPNLVSNLIDIESLTSKALITQTYTIETNHKFFRDLYTGTEKSAVKILSPADAQFSSVLSKLKSFKTKTKSYTLRPSKQIEFFVGGSVSYPHRDGDTILIKNFKNGADFSISGEMINNSDGAIRMNIGVIEQSVSEDESLLPNVTSVFETQLKNSRHTVTIENGSSLILIVAPKALNLKHNLGKQAQKQTQFFNKRDIKDEREIYAVHVTLSDMK